MSNSMPAAGAPPVTAGIAPAPSGLVGGQSPAASGDAGAPSGPSVDAGAGPSSDATGPTADATGPTGDASGAGGSGGAGAGGDSVMVSYTLRHLGVPQKRATVYWQRVKNRLLAAPDGATRYTQYQATARRITAVIDGRPALEGNVIVTALAMTLIHPFRRRSTPEDDARAIRTLEGTVRALAAMYGVEIAPLAA